MLQCTHRQISLVPRHVPSCLFCVLTLSAARDGFWSRVWQGNVGISASHSQSCRSIRKLALPLGQHQTGGEICNPPLQRLESLLIWTKWLWSLRISMSIKCHIDKTYCICSPYSITYDVIQFGLQMDIHRGSRGPSLTLAGNKIDIRDLSTYEETQ